jgi:hypothetical protein
MATALSDVAAELGIQNHFPAMKAKGHMAEAWRGIIPAPMSDKRRKELEEEMLWLSESGDGS